MGTKTVVVVVLEVLVVLEVVEVVSAGAGVSAQKQDTASALDIIEPGGALFYGFCVEDILSFDVFVKWEAFQCEES